MNRPSLLFSSTSPLTYCIRVAVVLLVCANAWSGSVGHAEDILSVATLQGDPAHCNGATPARFSTAACADSQSTIPLHIETADSYSECAYLDNASNQTYFVPFYTKVEWVAFKVATPRLGVTLRPCITQVGSQVFTFNGAIADNPGTVRTFAIPDGATKITVKAWGAAGSHVDYIWYGVGGYSEGTFNVSDLGGVRELKVVVGGNNIRGVSEAAGMGGETDEHLTCGGVAKGGGFSGVFLPGGVNQASAIVVAGGGASLALYLPSCYAGQGFSSWSRGGNGNDPTHSGGEVEMAGTSSAAAAGGGGYHGGGRAPARNGNMNTTIAEGGSGYVHPLAVSRRIEATPDMQVDVVPNMADLDYAGSGAGLPGNHGRVVIDWE